MKNIRIFIASPGDVSEERDIASIVVAEINRIFGETFGVNLDAVRWETHAWPDVGDDAQNVINTQIGEFDVLVGVMWRRFGSPTKRSKSGTGEEFQRAYDLFRRHHRPKIMFYFRTTSFYTTDLAEITQFRKVAEFQKALEKLGVLYWTYDTPLQFERNLREHLVRQILRLAEIKTSPEVAGAGEGEPETRPKRGPQRPSVFLAYSHLDKDDARSLYRALGASGYRVWLDQENLVPGQLWHREVDRAIRVADVVLLLLSSRSDLNRGFLAKEIDVAARLGSQSKGPILIPVRLDNVEPPERLRQIQWVDYFTPDGLERLLGTINRVWEERRRGER